MTDPHDQLDLISMESALYRDALGEFEITGDAECLDRAEVAAWGAIQLLEELRLAGHGQAEPVMVAWVNNRKGVNRLRAELVP